ncbi:hypothetical protein OG257_20410 [Streptomyces sp. NBC_00683]|uniref:hypothetical protein n=1 Tax=Streptomyces sp. NBC_00683 TaxID=2903670 RepID=UPI002E318D5D|nr:hypothetical protein [Streptomyces sp. NBC_00683]
MNPEREDPRPPELEALLDAASRPGGLGPAAEEKALRAFRTARENGVHASPLRWRRRRDDWRPADERRRSRSLKVLLAGVVTAVALGGVAVAVEEGAVPLPFGGGAEPKPGQNAPTVPGSGEASADEGSGWQAPQRPPRSFPSTAPQEPPRERPGTAQDTAAHCRVHLAAAQGRGRAPGDAATTRLEEAAGSRKAVPGYCERLLEGEQQAGTGAKAAERSPAHPEKPATKDVQAPAGPGAAQDSGAG